MTIRVSNLKLPVELPEAELGERLVAALEVRETDISNWRILRKSLDARSRVELHFVYSIAVETPPEVEASLLNRHLPGVDVWQPPAFDDPQPGTTPLNERPVIVGSGPAGILAGYYLALKGFRPLIIERGFAVKERVPAIRRFDSGGQFEPQNNYLFGEGGAGTFSDGKLTCRLTGPDVDWVFQQFAEFSGKPHVVYENRPHLGSNRLPMVVRNFRRRIEELGGEYRFECQLEGLEIVDGQIRAALTSSGRIELGRWVREQSISITMHRHGRLLARPVTRVGCPAGDDKRSH